ncbi:putative arabinosyltransferase ARAD1 [Iris pallida]|uniref:Arabinosyltransferase ARAD1 n=1 Tax=Iris pallida TaxID=29817 RepID=A0AAX6G739_IRIPA|nr:putative arabinosyltransferase ARAD1 [Iris pallida]
MLESRMRLWPCMFVLSDFGRYPPVANVEKDVVAPYRHMVRSYANDSSDFDSRTTLMYFQGAIHRKDGGHIRGSCIACSGTRRTCTSRPEAYRTGSARQPEACAPPSSASTSPGTPPRPTACSTPSPATASP